MGINDSGKSLECVSRPNVQRGGSPVNSPFIYAELLVLSGSVRFCITSSRWTLSACTLSLLRGAIPPVYICPCRLSAFALLVLVRSCNCTSQSAEQGRTGKKNRTSRTCQYFVSSPTPPIQPAGTNRSRSHTQPYRWTSRCPDFVLVRTPLNQ